MATERSIADTKLVQYLIETYGKEHELETALQAHIAMAAHDGYRQRLEEHLGETRAQAQALHRRIAELGGRIQSPLPVPVPSPRVAVEMAAAVTAAATKTMALAKGPFHALRGTSQAEKQLKNAKDDLWNEYEEIGNYLALESVATTLGDAETAGMARDFRAQEERMAAFLVELIPELGRTVAARSLAAGELAAGGGSSGSAGASSGSAPG